MLRTIGEIDLTKKPIVPKLFLATPGKKVIAKLIDAYGINTKVKLGSINELSFVIPYNVERYNSLVRNPYIDKVKDRYLIKYVLGDKVEWYQINKVTDSMDNDGDTRQVSAMLLPYELRDKILRKYKAESKNCSTILNDILVGSDALNPLTLWRIGYIDGSFDVVFRSFDISSKTTLDFIFEVAETFGAIVIWNTENRTIDFRRPDLIGINRGLKVSYDKYAKTISKESITDEMTTRLKVFGKDDISIQRLNPTGTNYIESFSYFLYPFQQDLNGNVVSHSNYMSDDLCKAILSYDAKIEEIKGEFSTITENKKNAVNNRTTKEVELVDLENQLAQIQDRIDIQHANQTVISQVNSYTGIPKSYAFSMSGGLAGRQFAIIVKVVNTTNITVKYGGVPKTLTSNVWTVIGRKNLTSNQSINDSILVEGIGSTNIHLLVVNITSSEYNQVIYEGMSFASNGANPSIVTSTEVGVDWSSVEVGNKVYVKRSSGESWNYDVSQYVGDVASKQLIVDPATGDITGWNVTLTTVLTTGPYSFGYAFVGNNDSFIVDKYSIDNKTMQINSKNSEIATIDSEIDGYDTQITNLKNQIKIENFFTTQTLRDERNQFIIEKEWSDTNYIDDQSLYDAAIKKFEQIRSPQTVIQIDIVNFLSIVEAQRDWNKLVLGDTITITYEKIGINVKAKIIEIEYDYESDDIKLVIANVKDIETDEEKLIKMLYKSISTSATVDQKKFDWDGAARDVSETQALLEGKWEAAKREIIAGVNESVVIDARGLTIKDPNDPLRFLRATHGVLGITNDGGNSFKHAITADGIVAERLYGQIIVGQTLTLGDVDGIFRIVGNKATISDRTGSEVMKLGLYDNSNGEKFGLSLIHSTHRVLMDRDEGFKIDKKNGDGTYTSIAWLDTSGKLNLNDIIASGTIEATTIKAGVKLTVGNIDVGNLITDLNEGLQTVNGWIKTGMIEAQAITAEKIKTDELIVGTNISMGPNATISWSNINGRPTNIASLSDINWNNVKGTVISGGGISTELLVAGTALIKNALIESVSADKITAGTISASISMTAPTITGGTITGGTIIGSRIQTATSGSRIVLSPADGYADTYWYSSGGANYFRIYDGVSQFELISNINLIIQTIGTACVYGNGKWNFTGEVNFSGPVTGVTAVFG